MQRPDKAQGVAGGVIMSDLLQPKHATVHCPVCGYRFKLCNPPYRYLSNVRHNCDSGLAVRAVRYRYDHKIAADVLSHIELVAGLPGRYCPIMIEAVAQEFRGHGVNVEVVEDIPF